MVNVRLSQQYCHCHVELQNEELQVSVDFDVGSNKDLRNFRTTRKLVEKSANTYEIQNNQSQLLGKDTRNQ